MHLQDSEVVPLMQMTYRPARHLAQATCQHSYVAYGKDSHMSLYNL